MASKHLHGAFLVTSLGTPIITCPETYFNVMKRINQLLYFVGVMFFNVFSIGNISASQPQSSDSLLRVLKQTQSDTSYARLCFQLVAQQISTDSATALYYLRKLQSDILAQKVELPSTYFYKTAVLTQNYLNDYQTSAQLFGMASQQEKQQAKPQYVYYGAWQAYTLLQADKPTKALQIAQQLVSEAEATKLDKQLPFAYLILAFIYRDINELDKAAASFLKSYQSALQANDSTQIPTALHELGNIYSIQRKTDLALKYHKQALSLRERIGHPLTLAYSYNDIAMDYVYADSLQKAEQFYSKASHYATQAQDRWTMVRITISRAENLLQLNKPAQVKSLLPQIQSLANELQIKSIYAAMYQLEYNFYKSTGDYRQALQQLELATVYRDSVSNEEVRKNLDELNMKYETARKDKAITENQARIKRQSIVIGFSLAGIVLVTLLLFLFYTQYKAKKSAYQSLEIKNNEILKQQEEIQAQAEHLEAANIEITQQRDFVATQRDLVEKANQSITDSIRYARRIQNAVMPPMYQISNAFKDSFIHYAPRDIVSGDFFWFRNIISHKVLAVADCTGHGVPGAFMSMLGISMLNELVDRNQINKPADLLEAMRKQTKTALRQNGKINEAHDGMDMALITISTNNYLQFAGAHSNLLLVRSKEYEAPNAPHTTVQKTESKFVLYEIKGTPNPIGIYAKEQAFVNHTFKLMPNDCVYLYTDGITDQFGGKNAQKFSKKQLKTIIQSLAQLDMDSQKRLLRTAFKVWKGTLPQVDDMLIVGLRF